MHMMMQHVASIKQLKNLINNNFIDSDNNGWADGCAQTGSVASKSVENNVQTFTASAQHGGFTISISANDADVIYTCALMQTLSTSANLGIKVGTSTKTSNNVVASNDYVFVSARHQMLVGEGATLKIQVRDSSSSNFQSIKVKKLYVFNLTQDLQNNIPSRYDLDAYWQYKIIQDYKEKIDYVKLDYKRNENFEVGLISNWWAKAGTMPYSLSIVDLNGVKCLRSELNITDPLVGDRHRAEINLGAESTGLEEHWYGVDIYLPNENGEDYAIDPNSYEIITQWHNVPDTDLGEGWTVVPLALCTKNGNYEIHRAWDENPVSTTYGMQQSSQTSIHNLGTYSSDLGKWVRWVYHVKWGWLFEHNTILEVYKDGIKVLDCNGLPNMTNDEIGVYLKVGIYKVDWIKNPNPSILTRRVIYHKNVSIDNPKDIALKN